MGCDIHPIVEVKRNGKWKFAIDYRNDIDKLGARNYNLFSVLANVRNGTWSELIAPISNPRGLPEDTIIDEENDSLGDHSFSWVTLDELLNYNWDQPITMRAQINKEQLSKWDGKSEPENYCAWGNNCVPVSWQSTVRKAVGDYFFNEVIPELQELDSDPKNIRIVFGFDS